MLQIPPISHLSYYPSESCHLIACQFERQWLPGARLFMDPIEQALAFLPLWHLPPSQQVFLPKIPQEIFDLWLTTSSPPNLERACHTLPQHQPIQLFGISPLALAYIEKNRAQAGKHAASELIHTLHDKRYIEKLRPLRLDPHLPSGWISSFEALTSLMQTYPQKRWMVKRPWASAGLGNLRLEPHLPLPTQALQRWLAFDGGWIVQPFVERILDFSSLWWIHEQGTHELFTLTRMQIGENGRYMGCLLAKPSILFQEELPLIEAHLEQAKDLLSKLATSGYRGPIGLDGMIYHDSVGQKRQTIIEINVRQTLAMHLASIAATMYPDFQKKDKVLARLIPPGSGLKTDRLLLPCLPRSFNLAIHLVS